MLLANINASLLRFCAEFADAHPNMEVVNFDAHADEGTLPKSDVVGLSSVSISVDENLCSVDLLFGVSTREDTNLFRLNQYMAELFEMVLPEEHISLYDAYSGLELGTLVVTNGTRTLTIGGSSSRPLQYVMLNLVSTKTFR